VLATAGNVKKPIGFSELRTDLQCFSKSQDDKQTAQSFNFVQSQNAARKNVGLSGSKCELIFDQRNK